MNEWRGGRLLNIFLLKIAFPRLDFSLQFSTKHSHAKDAPCYCNPSPLYMCTPFDRLKRDKVELLVGGRSNIKSRNTGETVEKVT